MSDATGMTNTLACGRQVSSEPLGILNHQQAGHHHAAVRNLWLHFLWTSCLFLPVTSRKRLFVTMRRMALQKGFSQGRKASSLRDRPSSGRPSFACGWPSSLDRAWSPESCQATCCVSRASRCEPQFTQRTFQKQQPPVNMKLTPGIRKEHAFPVAFQMV